MRSTESPRNSVVLVSSRRRPSDRRQLRRGIVAVSGESCSQYLAFLLSTQYLTTFVICTWYFLGIPRDSYLESSNLTLLHLISLSPVKGTRQTRSRDEPCLDDTICGAEVSTRSANMKQNKNPMIYAGMQEGRRIFPCYLNMCRKACSPIIMREPGSLP